jgi:hypothetical protein
MFREGSTDLIFSPPLHPPPPNSVSGFIMEALCLLTRVEAEPTVGVRIHAVVLLDNFLTFSEIISRYAIIITVLFIFAFFRLLRLTFHGTNDAL